MSNPLCYSSSLEWRSSQLAIEVEYVRKYTSENSRLGNVTRRAKGITIMAIELKAPRRESEQNG